MGVITKTCFFINRLSMDNHLDTPHNKGIFAIK